MIRPRAAMLTLYGDYILNRGGEIGIGTLISVLGNFGLSPQAVRSSVSRMRRAGLLKVRRVGRQSYYSLSKNGHNLLEKGAQRIFHRKNTGWDGVWNLVAYSIPERRRKVRDRLRLELGWMGYRALAEATWISPYDQSEEVEELTDRLQIKDFVQMFQAKQEGAIDPKKIVSRCWDLGSIHETYVNFIDKYRPKLERHLKCVKDGEYVEPSECFVERFNLIHEYRKLPYLDPDLPQELLPENWLRPKAAALFDEYYATLSEKSNEYFDSVSKEYKSGNGSRRRGNRRNKQLVHA